MRGARLLALVALGGAVWAQFSDVPPGHWAREAIDQLTKEGVLYGYPDGTFRPEEGFTRAQAAATLWRLILQYRLKDLRELSREDIERLKALLESVELWRKEAQASQEAVGGLADGLKDLRARLGSLEAELSALAGEGVEAAREALRQLQEVTARVSQLEGLVYKSLKDYREEVNTLGEALREADARLKAFEEVFRAAREEDRRTLEEKWSGVSASLAQLGTRLASVEALASTVRDLEQGASLMGSRLNALEAQLEDLRRGLSRLREEMPRVRFPKAFGVGVYLTGLDSGFAVVEYALRSGFSLRVLGALGSPGPYASAGIGYRFEGDGLGYRLGLGVGQGFYGPGFAYGEASFGLKVDVIGGLSLAAEGVQSFPFGTGPGVFRLGLGVMYQW